MRIRASMTVLAAVVLVCGIIGVMAGCKPGSGDYGVVNLNGTKDDEKPIPGAPALTANLSGVVTSSGNPQPNRAVRVFNEAGVAVGETVTAASGEFLFQALPVGTYRLAIGYDSGLFAPATYTVIIRTDGAVFPNAIALPLTVIASSSGTPVVAGDILGVTVSAETMQGVANVEVRLFSALGQEIGLTVTSANGQFIFQQIVAGNYALGLARGSTTHQPATYSVVIRADGTMFPTTLSLPLIRIAASPPPVVVQADIIGAAVSADTLQGVANVEVRLLSALGQEIGLTTTSANGQFIFQQIATGNYTLGLARGSTTHQPATYSVVIRADGTMFPTTLSLPLVRIVAPPPPVVVQADVVGALLAGTSSLPQANVGIRLVATNGSVVGTTVSAVTGEFLFQGVATGTYLLGVAFDSSVFAPATYSCTVKSDGTVFPANLTIRLVYRAGETGGVTANVAGVVALQSTNAPVENVDIAIWNSATLVAADVTPPTGEFLFPRLAPGSYQARIAVASTLFNAATYSFLIRDDGTVFPTTLRFRVSPKGPVASPVAVDVLGQVIEVKIVGSDTNELPVKNVQVELRQGTTLIDTAMTPPTGEFIFTQLDIGTYLFVISKAAYQTATYTFVVQQDGTTLPEVAKLVID